MSLRGFSTPVQVDNAVSPRLVAAAAALHALAAVVVLWLPVPLAGRLGGLLVLAGCGCEVLRILLLRAGRRCIVRMELEAGGRWRLTNGRGEVFTARLANGSRVSLPLLSLRWRDDRGRRHGAFLAADAMDTELMRRLRVRLRFGSSEWGERNQITET